MFIPSPPCRLQREVFALRDQVAALMVKGGPDARQKAESLMKLQAYQEVLAQKSDEVRGCVGVCDVWG